MIAGLCCLCNISFAQTAQVIQPEQCNMPLFQTKYTADPSPIVVGDTLSIAAAGSPPVASDLSIAALMHFSLSNVINV